MMSSTTTTNVEGYDDDNDSSASNPPSDSGTRRWRKREREKLRRKSIRESYNRLASVLYRVDSNFKCKLDERRLRRHQMQNGEEESPPTLKFRQTEDSGVIVMEEDWSVIISRQELIDQASVMLESCVRRTDEPPRPRQKEDEGFLRCPASMREDEQGRSPTCDAKPTSDNTTTGRTSLPHKMNKTSEDASRAALIEQKKERIAALIRTQRRLAAESERIKLATESERINLSSTALDSGLGVLLSESHEGGGDNGLGSMLAGMYGTDLVAASRLGVEDLADVFAPAAQRRSSLNLQPSLAAAAAHLYQRNDDLRLQQTILEQRRLEEVLRQQSSVLTTLGFASSSPPSGRQISTAYSDAVSSRVTNSAFQQPNVVTSINLVDDEDDESSRITARTRKKRRVRTTW